MIKTDMISRDATDHACICCGARRWKLQYADIVRCTSCGYQRMHEVLTADDLKRIYDAGYFTGDKYHDYPAEKHIIQANFEARLKTLARWAEANGPLAGQDLFEIGSAYGFFLELADDRFRTVRGMDVATEAVQHARDSLGLDVTAGDVLTADLTPASYDVVCMWDTIEHLGEAERYVKRAYELLKPGGLLCMTTGDVDAWVARLQRRKWRLYDPPQHVHYFSPASLGKLSKRVGFEVAHSETCAFLHSVEQIVHGLGWYSNNPGLMGRICRWLYPRLPDFIKKIAFPIDLRDIFLIVCRKPR